jgi:hypothetical protein
MAVSMSAGVKPMKKNTPKTELDERLDDALMATFPCSDPFNFQTAEDNPSPPAAPNKQGTTGGAAAARHVKTPGTRNR